MVRIPFIISNKGNSELILKDVRGTCSCMMISFPHYALQKDQEDTIVDLFHTQMRQGFQKKKVYVIANTNPSTSILTFTGYIYLKKKEEF